jgi:hypothetical protein
MVQLGEEFVEKPDNIQRSFLDRHLVKSINCHEQDAGTLHTLRHWGGNKVATLEADAMLEVRLAYFCWQHASKQQPEVLGLCSSTILK